MPIPARFYWMIFKYTGSLYAFMLYRKYLYH